MGPVERLVRPLLTKRKEMNMKKFAMWSIAHSLHWAVLYGAFFASVDGAMYVLKFMVWTMAPLSVLLLVGQVAADVAKNPPTPVRNWMSMLQAWVTLGLLVWFGHIASALAWGLVMLVIALHREATKKARSAATSAALRPNV